MQTVIGSDIERAAMLLREGGLVSIPTETVYGLAANAESAQAVVQIFEVKARPAFDPLIVHISGADMLERYACHIPDAAYRLAEACWPGPLTLVLPRRSCIPDIVTSGLDTVGLRVPAHPLTLSLLRELDFPLAAPSANPFGYISPTTAQHVADQLGGKIPYILDGGTCSVGVESTIVGFEDGIPCVYRLGGLPMERLSELVGECKVRVSQNSNPRAPGMLESHYAPRVPLFLGAISELMKHHAGKRIGVLTFTHDWQCGGDVCHVEVLSGAGDVPEAATALFAALRRLDSSGIDCILAEPVPDVGIGRAVNDRLRRAAVG